MSDNVSIKDYVEAAYLHGLCVENLDTGELEPPRDISEVQWIVDKLEQKIAQETNKARIDPFDFVEPCEPDCSPERHAYHQGQWDMAGRINKHFGLPPHPVALTADKEQAALQNKTNDGGQNGGL